ncbi:MAG: hypothetical protein H7Y61_12805, partial [Rhizobiales bacterium]|nr:hypothetical protein [Rhizobacter sp.]
MLSTLLGRLTLTLTALAPLAPACAQPAVDVTPRILELESLGRAQPIESAAALQALRASTAALSSQRLELLTVQGLMLALVSQTEAAEVPAAQLRAWGSEPHRDRIDRLQRRGAGPFEVVHHDRE